MIAGLILAGGRATRMGGADKALLELAGRPLIAHVIERLQGQTQGLAISANGDPVRFANFALPVLADAVPDFPGPLAGILSGLEWAAANHPSVHWLLSAPCDAPFIPLDLVERLLQAVRSQGADLAIAASAGRSHPVIGLWPLSIASDLRQALCKEGLHKVGQFAGRYRKAVAEFPLENGHDPFTNVNTPDDLDATRRLSTGDRASAPPPDRR
jgi:molybdopterin-guanine dinucleotide biosynthesis protein A